MPSNLIMKAPPLGFDRLRPKHEQMLPLIFVKRDLLTIADHLHLDIVMGRRSGLFFRFLLLFARYRAWSMSMEDHSTWVSRPEDATITLYARQAVEQRRGVLIAIVRSLSLLEDDVVFLGEDNQVIPRRGRRQANRRIADSRRAETARTKVRKSMAPS